MDKLEQKTSELKAFFEKKGIKIKGTARLKSIHGADDDIMQIDINLSSSLNLLAADNNPGKFELVGAEKLYRKLEIDGDFFHKIQGIEDLGIILPEFPAIH